MIKHLMILLALTASFQPGIGQNAPLKGKILMIAANPSTSKITGDPIGVWASELTHPYWEFTQAGYEVEIASPDGGRLEFDSYSNPQDKSGYAADDLITRGWLTSKKHMDLLAKTKKLSDVKMGEYVALFVAGGQSPMVTFRNNKPLADFVAKFYESGKPTALVCHAACILLEAKLANGKLLVDGKTWTGFANSEEKYTDEMAGKRVQPFWIEDEAKKLKNTTFVVKPAFTPHAIADGNLITGQQQNSSIEAARLVLQGIAAYVKPMMDRSGSGAGTGAGTGSGTNTGSGTGSGSGTNTGNR
jgi:putative intracellular protease/amidase